MSEYEFKETIECLHAADVLVIGGGPSGIAAAVSAARLGKKVLLADNNGYLGGLATAGLVGPFMT
jgi:NADPH-dependent 2,4-dienoyl-CoA reductase/sulfur reductase-like enzyme